MQGFLVLCDSASTDRATGKISMLGAGWSLTGPELPSTAIAGFLRVPWNEARTDHTFTLGLAGEDGEPVMVSAAGRERPLRFSGQLAVNPADTELDELARSLDIHSSFAISVHSLSLAPGRYTWALEVDGEDLASVTFGVRADPDADAE
ncbi:DUF6941 family protein [Streptosporangium sp. CA-135522]|uniref:DUF6941 family protein n=1 Tax=Streptosporangium sp. CA-135522 TaxID=3240072 RepID=UPI003D8B959D